MARAKKERHVPVFWICLVLFALLMVGAWAYIIDYVRGCMVIYEAAQPEYLVDHVTEQLMNGQLTGQMDFTTTRFEDIEVARSVYGEQLQNKTITWRVAPGHIDPQCPAYQLCADGSPVAVLTLRVKSSQVLMLILTLQEWEVDSVEPLLGTLEPWTIVAPDTYTVTVNGIPVDDRELTGERVELEQFQYAAPYVSTPALVEYRVGELFRAPVIEIRDPMGRLMEPCEDEDQCLAVDEFLPADMDPELEAYVLKNAKDYSNFLTADLPGCTRSIDPIRHMFPEGSYYLDLAENFRRFDMKWTSIHDDPVFSQEQVTNYTEYSPELFSCDVFFDKMMYLTKTGQKRHAVTNTRFYYVNLNGTWLIADMQQIIGGSQNDTV